MTRLYDLWRRARRPDGAPDDELLQRFIQAGDEAAFAELVARYGPVVYGACRRHLANPADVEDAFQATFLVLVARGGSLSGRRLGPWLYRVAVWTARNLRRRNSRRATVPLDPLTPALPSGSDLRLDLDAALMALPPRDREAVVLCHLRGWSRRDAAAHLGCPEGTLSAILSRALVKLRKRLAGADPSAALTVAVVPAGLAAGAVRAAAAYRDVSLSAAGLSPAVADLTRGVLRMFWVKKAAAGLVAAAVLVTGLGIGFGSGTGPQAVAQAPKPPAKADPTPDDLALRIKLLEAQIELLKSEANDLRQRRVVADLDRLVLKVAEAALREPYLRIEVRTTAPEISVIEFARGNRRAGRFEPTDEESLKRHLTRARKDPTGPREVVVAADPDTPRETVRSLTRICQEAGFDHLSAEVSSSAPRKALPAYVIEPPDLLQIEAAVRGKASDGKDELWSLNPQPLMGEYLVRPDGTVSLGVYGAVNLSGLTIEQAAQAIRKHLAGRATHHDKPIKPDDLLVVLDVKGYNSKKYYVIVAGSPGEQVFSFPVTGSDTVLDAMANVRGQVDAAAGELYVSRRADGQQQVLPVDWVGITQHGKTETNYQLLPGDRLYVRPKK